MFHESSVSCYHQLLLGLEVGMQLWLYVTDKLEQSLHRLVLVGLHAAINLVNLLPRCLLNLRFHVTARTEDLSTDTHRHIGLLIFIHSFIITLKQHNAQYGLD